ncbi:flagellar export chaperone FliS [Actomonas aquatica]|uniref:Flagellar secretion chaperone FliS n=1 Tax=Actomonas aquatica TaxID=2866162 RepID=A0ABZ1CCX3_9BACT|nr:flagellar export chaperone FliS [Opitutus sp. WL0086]WRQ89328.1 flagellar export chaperone FliS [Opitutus sp. WL0086]
MMPAAYARQYQNQAVLSASPGQLVLMLYDGTLRFLRQAIDGFSPQHDEIQSIAVVHTALGKAGAILAELQSNLDHAAGGEYAANLDRLYDYYQRRLHEANIKKDVEAIQEVLRLVTELRDGWAEMLRQQETPAVQVA